MEPIREQPPDPQYLDAFLQGARFALFALEGRIAEDDGSIPPELETKIDEAHEMFSATRDGLQARETSLSSIRRYVGKN